MEQEKAPITVYYTVMLTLPPGLLRPKTGFIPRVIGHWFWPAGNQVYATHRNIAWDTPDDLEQVIAEAKAQIAAEAHRMTQQAIQPGQTGDHRWAYGQADRERSVFRRSQPTPST